MAYKGRILDCLTSEGRKFFKDEFKVNDKEASLRRIENLIIDVVLPYKIGLGFFLATTLALGGYLFFWKDSGGGMSDQTTMKAENLKLREDLDSATRRLNIAIGATGADANAASAGLDNMVAIDAEQFYDQLGDLAETKKITREEIVRLIKVGASRDAAMALRRVQAKTALSSVLSAAEMAELIKAAAAK